MTRVFLGLGTNVGDRAGNLRAALRGLRPLVRINAVSSVYESEPVGYAEQPDFWNIVVEADTDLGPHELMAGIFDVERALGRERSFRNAPRTIDIDILLYGDRVLDDEKLRVPHPRMTERAFVLRPLIELDDALVHPVTGRRFADSAAERQLERIRVLGAAAEILNGDAAG